MDKRPWLDRQPEAFREHIMALSRPRIYAAGTSMALMGEEIDDFIGIRRGCVAIHWDGFGKQSYQIQFMWPGDWIGEHALITNMPRKISAVASTEVEILAVSAEKLRHLLNDHPGYWKSLADLANEHMALAVNTLIDRMHSGSIARCAAALLGFVRAEGPNVSDCGGLSLPITQFDLAQLAGLSRNSVGAALKKLRDAGLVEGGYGYIRVASVVGLRAHVDRLIS